MLLNYYKDWCKNCTRDIITTCDSFGGWVRCNLMICYADQWILRLMIAACCLYWELLLDIVLLAPTHSLLAYTWFLKGKDSTLFFIIRPGSQYMMHFCWVLANTMITEILPEFYFSPAAVSTHWLVSWIATRC